MSLFWTNVVLVSSINVTGSNDAKFVSGRDMWKIFLLSNIEWKFLLHTKVVISFENIGNIGNIGRFYFTQKLPSTWGYFILLSHDNLSKFKVIGRKILNFLSDLYRFIDKYWKFRLNIKIAYDLGVFHEPRVNWRSWRSWLNKALFLSMPFLVQSSQAYL